MLRYWVRVTSALALCSAAGIAAADSPPRAVDPFRLYGNQITFDVERDGDVVGRYVIDFTRTDQGVLAEARVDVDVNLLFVPVYSLRYHARELWSGGELLSIEASTDDDGDLVHLQATRDAEGLQVQTNNGAYETPAVLPISHWNAALLEGGPLLNGMTGEVDEVRLSAGSQLARPERFAARAALSLFRRSQRRDLVRRGRTLGEAALPRQGWVDDRLHLPQVPGADHYHRSGIIRPALVAA